MQTLHTPNYKIDYEFYWDDCYIAIWYIKDNNNNILELDRKTEDAIREIMNETLQIGNNHMDNDSMIKIERLLEWFQYIPCEWRRHQQSLKRAH